jgi:phage baseplate assembly protein W
MTTFVGYNTIGQNKNFTLVGDQLVLRDLLNAFNIRQGEVVGLPGYGTTLWSYIFESQTLDTERAIFNEIQRVCALDPRIFLNSVQLYPQLNGLLIQLQLTIVPSTEATLLNLFLNQDSRTASYV